MLTEHLWEPMAFAELDNVNYGVLKNLVLGNLETWMKRPIFDHAGLLTIGYGYSAIEMSETITARVLRTGAIKL